MSKIDAVFAPLGVFLMILNTLGRVVSGIWLALLGEWWALGVGAIGLILSQFLISILLMPRLIFVTPAAALFDRGKHL